jgi:hypothetical protein
MTSFTESQQPFTKMNLTGECPVQALLGRGIFCDRLSRSVIPSKVEGPCVSGPGAGRSYSFCLIPHKDVSGILSGKNFVRSETKLGQIDFGK